MMVCRIESRSSDDVSALATSWKMVSSWLWRVNCVPVASGIPKYRMSSDKRVAVQKL